MAFSGKPVTPDVVVDETWISSLQEIEGYVIDTLLQPTLNETVEMILNFVNDIFPQLSWIISMFLLEMIARAKTYPDAYYRSIDVRDVAVTHVQALEIPSGSGRYCLVADDLHFSELLKIIHKHHPTLQLTEE
ncbi:phenylacetaldehyde reductase-like [Hevea brasiliensis]|uniref:phenylacetaldehyde reductase-like n=1 Tax=Hevea brasiliensis TaxID=3981 RepID=UPI0025FFE0A7|nr:phenylacetaldehyde reductase-like [Hevea brasiliensis]